MKNRSFELDSVMYINDVKKLEDQFFLYQKFQNQVALYSWQPRLAITYHGKLKTPEKNESFFVENFRDQTIVQGLLANKTNHLSVFFTSKESTFNLSAYFE